MPQVEEWMRKAAQELRALYGRVIMEAPEYVPSVEEGAQIIAEHAPEPQVCDKVKKRMGLHSIAVSGLWIRRIGDYVELLAENPETGEFVEICREWYNSSFSHIAEPSRVQANFSQPATKEVMEAMDASWKKRVEAERCPK